MENIVVILMLVLSIFTDLRNRKILNIVTLPAIVGAILYYVVTAGFDGFLYSGQGFLVGLGLLFIPFILGGIGAGDVKLLAAVGAWKGALFIFHTGIYAGLIGGLIALFLLLKRKELGITLKSMLFSVLFMKETKGSLLVNDQMKSSVSIPYAIPIALGAFAVFMIGTTQ